MPVEPDFDRPSRRTVFPSSSPSPSLGMYHVCSGATVRQDVRVAVFRTASKYPYRMCMNRDSSSATTCLSGSREWLHVARKRPHGPRAREATGAVGGSCHGGFATGYRRRRQIAEPQRRRCCRFEERRAIAIDAAAAAAATLGCKPQRCIAVQRSLHKQASMDMILHDGWRQTGE